MNGAANNTARAILVGTAAVLALQAGVLVTPASAQYSSSPSYQWQDAAIKRAFRDALRRRRGLKVGIPLDTRQLAFSIDRYFGGADAEFVVFKSAGEFFAGGQSGVDAFLMPAEGGAAFTLLHPEFAVVVPQPDPVRLPYAFGLAPDAERMADAVNEWIVFAQSEGMVQRAYDYWVLGRGAEDRRPRWSILRNVLGWRPDDERR